MTSSDRSDHYDVVIVGARAGAATGMLWPRRARRACPRAFAVRERHAVNPRPHARCRPPAPSLGVLPDRSQAGTPPVRRTTFHVGNEPTLVDIKPSYGVDALYAPRRTVLDPILADAAIAAGARDPLRQHRHSAPARPQRSSHRHHRPRRQRAIVRCVRPITIGADGMNSAVARWVQAPVHRASTSAAAFVYGHWTGVAADGYDWFFRPGAAAGSYPRTTRRRVFVGTTPQRFRRELLRNRSRGVPRAARSDGARGRGAPGQGETSGQAPPLSWSHRLHPPAVGTGLGTRGRRRLLQGPHRGARTHRRPARR